MVLPMKTFTVREAEGQLARLISAANEGEIIVLKDGDKEATLYPRALSAWRKTARNWRRSC